MELTRQAAFFDMVLLVNDVALSVCVPSFSNDIVLMHQVNFRTWLSYRAPEMEHMLLLVVQPSAVVCRYSTRPCSSKTSPAMELRGQHRHTFVIPCHDRLFLL